MWAEHLKKKKIILIQYKAITLRANITARGSVLWYIRTVKKKKKAI